MCFPWLVPSWGSPSVSQEGSAGTLCSSTRIVPFSPFPVFPSIAGLWWLDSWCKQVRLCVCACVCPAAVSAGPSLRPLLPGAPAPPSGPFSLRRLVCLLRLRGSPFRHLFSPFFSHVWLLLVPERIHRALRSRPSCFRVVLLGPLAGPAGSGRRALCAKCPRPPLPLAHAALRSGCGRCPRSLHTAPSGPGCLAARGRSCRAGGSPPPAGRTGSARASPDRSTRPLALTARPRSGDVCRPHRVWRARRTRGPGCAGFPPVSPPPGPLQTRCPMDVGCRLPGALPWTWAAGSRGPSLTVWPVFSVLHAPRALRAHSPQLPDPRTISGSTSFLTIS